MQVKKLRRESPILIGTDIVSSVKANDQRAITRFVSKATPKRIIESRTLRASITEHLDTLRGQWAFWQEQLALSHLDESGISPIMIHNALQSISTEGKALKASLEEIQPLSTIGELIRKGEDSQSLELLIVDMILAFRDTLSIANNITPIQAKDAAMIIVENFPTLSFEELAMCFHRAKVGEYGEIMHRLDTNVILSWLNKFSKEMSQTSLELNSQQHTQLKRFETDGKNSDLDLLKWYKILPSARDADKDLYKQKQIDNRADKYFGGF